MPSGMLERDSELVALTDAVRAAATSRGSVVLVHGEAGIGKSSLVQALAGRLPRDARLLVGHCDDLATPRLLGPLRDVSGSVGAELARSLRDPADRDRLYSALHRELDWSGHATVLVVEDAQWADEATLDVLRYLVRRLPGMPVVLVLTYRDDLAAGHPLRRLLSTADSSGVARRLALGPLSVGAVDELARGTGRDAGEVHELTGGNPFFVQQVLAAAGNAVPASVVDSVLARLGELDEDAREAVHRLSVVTASVDRRTLEALVPGGIGVLAGAESRGLVSVAPDRVGFRHELTRRAVHDALPVARRADLNATALAALESLPAADPAQLVHHAAQAGDVAAVVRLGPVAARAAADGGSHPEAAAHYRLLLSHRDQFDPGEQAELLQASAIECYTSGDEGRDAIADQREAVALRRTLGDPVELGISLRWLSRLCWWYGDRPGAEAAGREAVEVLAGTDDRRALALALSNSSQLAMLAEQHQQAADSAEQAIALARELDEVAVLAHGLNNLGTARLAAGDPGGRELLEESLRVAVAAGLSEHASRASCNLVWHLLTRRELDDAATYVERGIELAEAAEQIGFWKYLHMEKGMIALAQARWDDAEACARLALEATTPIRCAALVVLGTVALRTGRDARAYVDEAWRLAVGLAELQRTGPAGALVCEEAWLRGDTDTVLRVAGEVHAEAARLGSRVWEVQLGHWLAMAGRPVDLTGDDPFVAMAHGRWRQAAEGWEAAGYPLEHAWALTRCDDTDTVLAGLARLDALGARAHAAEVRARLRERGTPRVPRGPVPVTRANVAGLTARQLHVLGLVAEGLSNAEIAEQLVLSVRTVDHHVEAVLAKLGAASRGEAVRLATERGWSPTSRAR